MEINKATEDSRGAISSLLQSQHLPAEDLPQSLEGFFTAMHDGRVVGLIGLEQYGQFGLLRSMVVDPEYRNQKIAERLATTLETYAITSNIGALFLLTETAEGYFTRKGYRKILRDEVPAAVRKSSEFSHVCPVSATVMTKELVAGSI